MAKKNSVNSHKQIDLSEIEIYALKKLLSCFIIIYYYIIFILLPLAENSRLLTSISFWKFQNKTKTIHTDTNFWGILRIIFRY
jgi:hypothetical protein